MSTKSEMAAELFSNGFNCAQSVIAAFCEEYDLESETALKLACGLGGGLRSGEICGAVSGAVLTIGLKYGQCIAEDSGAKMNCYARTEQFIEEFRAANGAIICRDILGYDISTDEGKIRARETDRRTSPCALVVKSAVNILEELGY